MDTKELAQFRNDFAKIYHEKVVPALMPFEQERLKTRKKAYFLSGITFLIIAGFLFVMMCGEIGTSVEGTVGPFIFIAFWGGFPAFLIYHSFKKKFELKIKERIMPVLMPAFGDMKWNRAYGVGSEEIRATRLFTKFERMENDDNFTGSYKGIPVRISETTLTYETTNSKGERETHTEFRGVVILIDIPKKFDGHTIIKRRFLGCGGPYKEVKLEDVEFSKEFYVSSTDQIEARYLITTAFMQRFKNIQRAFGAECIQCSFLNQKILLAVSVSKDLFSLGNLNAPVNDTKQFTVFLNEILSIYELIEELKLYQNIGM